MMNAKGWVDQVTRTDLSQESNQIYAYALALDICLQTKIPHMGKFMDDIMSGPDQLRIQDKWGHLLIIFEDLFNVEAYDLLEQYFFKAIK